MNYLALSLTVIVSLAIAGCGDSQLTNSSGHNLVNPGASVGKNCKSVFDTGVSQDLSKAKADARGRLMVKIRNARRELLGTGAKRIRVSLEPIRCATALPPADRIFGTSCTARGQVCETSKR